LLLSRVEATRVDHVGATNDQEVIMPNHPAPALEPVLFRAEPNPTHARFVCEYQLMSDWEGTYWLSEQWRAAKSLHGHDTLNEVASSDATLDITGCHAGVWGLQLLTFTVTVPLNSVNLPHDREEAGDWCLALLERYVIPDSDVECRWVSSVRP
jgi:hypothetical protein